MLNFTGDHLDKKGIFFVFIVTIKHELVKSV